MQESQHQKMWIFIAIYLERIFCLMIMKRIHSCGSTAICEASGRTRISLKVGFAVWFLCLMVSQTEGEVSEAMAEEPEAISFDFEPRSFFEWEMTGLELPKAPYNQAGDSLGKQEYETTLRWTSIQSIQSFFNTSFSYRRSKYDITGAPYEGSFRNVDRLRMTATVQEPLLGWWSWVANGRLSFAAADNASLADGMNTFLFGGVSVILGPNLQVSGGVAGLFEPNNKPWIIPLVSLRWTPSPQWTISTFNGVVVQYRTGPNEDWEWNGGVLYQTSAFAVRDLVGFREQEGSVEERFIEAYIGLTRKFSNGISVGIRFICELNRKYTYLKNEDSFNSIKPDSMTGINLRLLYRF